MAKKTARDRMVEVQDAAKTLLANIRFMSVDDPIHTIVITSSIPNEGKTFVSVNLAQAIATSGKTVLLVEGDMRKRSCAATIGVHPVMGIYAILSGQAGLVDAAIETPQKDLFFLDAEPHIPNPPDVLSSKRFADFFKKARATYDYVVFDTPPLGGFVDAAVLASMCDATLLVVREGFTKRADIEAAADQLGKSGGNLVGVVMNGCDTAAAACYCDYYDDSDVSSQNEMRRQVLAQQPAPARQAVSPSQRGAKNKKSRGGSGLHSAAAAHSYQRNPYLSPVDDEDQ